MFYQFFWVIVFIPLQIGFFGPVLINPVNIESTLIIENGPVLILIVMLILL